MKREKFGSMASGLLLNAMSAKPSPCETRLKQLLSYPTAPSSLPLSQGNLNLGSNKCKQTRNRPASAS